MDLIEGKGLQFAETNYRVLASTGVHAALVEFSCSTGRTHQIRVHSSMQLGTPLLGDAAYGPKHDSPFISTALRRVGVRSPLMHLHARSIAIPQFGPNGRQLKVVAPLPAHFKQTMLAFGFDTTPFEAKTKKTRWSRPNLTMFTPSTRKTK